jgi:hypothetical protein
MKKRVKKTPLKLVSPTEGITCPHGDLMPESAKGKAKRAAVSPKVWEYLEACWREAHAQDAELKAKAKDTQMKKDAAVAQQLARFAICLFPIREGLESMNS